MKEIIDKRSHRVYSMVAPSGIRVPIITRAKDVPQEEGVLMPYAVAVVLYRMHALSHLIKVGHSPNEAIAILNAYTPEQLTACIAKIQEEKTT